MKQLYAVYDRVSNQYLDPQAHLNDGVATRSFMMSCADPSIPESYLHDISLVHVGGFDENSGVVVPVNVRTVLFGDAAPVFELRNKYKEMISNAKPDAQENN